MSNTIRVCSLLELTNGKQYETAWTCNPRDPKNVTEVRRFFALAQERAVMLDGDAIVTLVSPSCEVVTFAPSIHEAREIKMWERALARLSER